ncbi:hypothetical protein EGW08_019121 [Elysia chlorotica]|uniref:Hexosyltransferase n=1 Tax=Elysia chlorotica TaxID=188477 RepID=A0A3S0ZA95_ELYCH|nr:hypothetical protein EGW08_019121 [Elysia chlorotica]
MWLLRSMLPRRFQKSLLMSVLLVLMMVPLSAFLVLLTYQQQIFRPWQVDLNIHRVVKHNPGTAEKVEIRRLNQQTTPSRQFHANTPRDLNIDRVEKHKLGTTEKDDRRGLKQQTPPPRQVHANTTHAAPPGMLESVDNDTKQGANQSSSAYEKDPGMVYKIRDHVYKSNSSYFIDFSNTSLRNDSMFVNITKIAKTKHIAAVVPDDFYLAQNQDVFNNRTSVINELNYDFYIPGSNVCDGKKSLFLLIIIPSVAGDVETRKTIRQTWLGAGERELWPRAKVGVVVKHIFLLGVRPRMNHTLLKAESALHGDLVIADFKDSYRNLTTKVLVGLKWTTQFCPQAQMVLKVDQDTMVNLPLMVRLLQYTRQTMGGASSSFVMGLAHLYPVVAREGRWFVSKDEYHLPYYPVYMYGHTYAMSAPGATTRLLEAARYFPLLGPEDAFITGVLPKMSGVSRVASYAFTVCCRRMASRCELVWNQRVALTGLNSVSLLDSVWANITEVASYAFTVCCRRMASRCELVWNQRVALTGLNSVSLLDSVWANITQVRRGRGGPGVEHRLPTQKVRGSSPGDFAPYWLGRCQLM